MTIHERIDRFRLAARELRNNHFRLSTTNTDWDLYERFQEVESKLFDALVAPIADLEPGSYGSAIARLICVPQSDRCPVMVNRSPGKSHGYWDHPVSEVSRDARLSFVSFFDWDQMASQDYHLIQVVVQESPGHPEITGHHALVEFHHVRLELTV